MSCLLHGLNDTVKAYQVMTVGQQGIHVGIKSPGCSEGIALNAGDLNQSQQRIAGETEEVFHGNGGSVFHLAGCAPEHLF